MSADLRALAERPHRRWNPLAGEWVLVSPHRALRPWQGQMEKTPPAERPPYDPGCYLCPGNARVGGVRNPAYTSTFVFENDFAALRPPAAGEPEDVRVDRGPSSSPRSESGQGAEDGGGGLLVAEAEPGRCRVICFSPRHDLTLGEMDVPGIRRVVDLWAEEYLALGSDPRIGHVQIFENRGEVMGSSNPHPHGQIWAQRSVPLTAAREGERLAAHRQRRGRTLLEDYLRLEEGGGGGGGERVVCANDAFVALVPFWAVWPFETLVVSRRPAPHLGALDDRERDALADILKRVVTRYDNVFEISFPYSAGIHQAPTDGRAHPEWHLHMHFYPPLLRSATVRKFLVGYEMMGEPQRDLTPETAAARLRAQSEVHFRAR